MIQTCRKMTFQRNKKLEKMDELRVCAAFCFKKLK